jgi:NADH dehydrogenase
VVEPRRITVSLTTALPRVRTVLGEATSLDVDARAVGYKNLEGAAGELGYDRLVLAVGSVNKLLPIPGVAENAHGFRGIPEAVYLRDHITRQIEQAATTDDVAERTARCTFVVVGAGYTGTEVAAQGQLLTAALARRRRTLAGQPLRWMLLDLADRVLPELDPRLSTTADTVLRERGVEVRMGTSVEEATGDGVRLTDGQTVPTRTLVWCVGVRPDPFVDGLGDRATRRTAGQAGRAQPGRRTRTRRTRGLPPPRPGVRRRPRGGQGCGEPVRRAAVRGRGEGRDPQLPPDLDAGQPRAHSPRLGG